MSYKIGNLIKYKIYYGCYHTSKFVEGAGIIYGYDTYHKLYRIINITCNMFGKDISLEESDLTQI
jgi:hypothetical protein